MSDEITNEINRLTAEAIELAEMMLALARIAHAMRRALIAEGSADDEALTIARDYILDTMRGNG